jgi:hypothetical protein
VGYVRQMATVATPTLSEGQWVRLLLKARDGSHVVESRIVLARPEELVVQKSEHAKPVAVPSSAIVSIELSTGESPGARWVPAALPRSMSALLVPVNEVFSTGAGAVTKSIDVRDTDAAIGVLEDARSQISNTATITVIDALLQSLVSLRLCQVSARFEVARRAMETTMERLEGVVALLGSYDESERFRLTATELASRTSTVTDRYWNHYQSSLEPRPKFSSYAEPTVVSVSTTGVATFSVRVQLDDSYAPVHRLELVLEEPDGVQLLGKRPVLEQLRAGETTTVLLEAVIDQTLVRHNQTVRLRGQLRYRQPNRAERISPKQNLDFRVHFPQPFEPIPNPFSAYAGGTTVIDAEMFFGHAELLAELSSRLRSGPLGQCFALYGQKRSGKSSLLEQARRQLDGAPIIPIAISLGTIDRHELTSSFVAEILEQVRVPLLDKLTSEDFRRLEKLWPSPSRIEKRPLESLRSSLTAGRQVLSKYPGWAGLRFVLLVDEFTYLFEILRRPGVPDSEIAALRDFMRQWKALLEGQYFSSLVVGQDTMPGFMRRFPNEFSSMTLRRLAYLKGNDALDLVTKPILLPDGSSRYIGYAGHTVYEYTEGHPFFTQIICDRLVRLANEKKRGDFTENDVVEAVQSLVSGSDALDFHRFDCLLTADNTGLITASPTAGDASFTDTYDDQGDAAFHMLRRIAEHAGEQNQAVDRASLNLTDEDERVIDDLILREVLTFTSLGLRIRVLLFADFLRRM